MAQILVRNLEPDVVARLKWRAKQNRRSLQSELKIILEAASGPFLNQAEGPDPKQREEFRKWAAELRASLADIPQTDSVELIREDRER